MRCLVKCFSIILTLFMPLFSLHGASKPCAGMSTGIGANLNGFVPFPASSPWNRNIANAPVDPNSAAIISFIGNYGLHPDFGAGTSAGSIIGVPYVVVDSSQDPVPINLGTFAAEGDPGPMPVPANAEWQGYPVTGVGDRHVIVLDNSSCMEYDLYHGVKQSDGSWSASVAAVWDLETVQQRPYTWTSSNAAGFAEFPGLVRYDEVSAGAINHALSFTLQHSRQAFTPPASHWAPSSTDSRAAPMGMRMRLKAGFDISGFPPEVRVILTALKKYGMIMTDNGAPMFLSGAPDQRWNNTNLHQLTKVTASDFEVVLISPLYTPSNVPKGPKPVISAFVATPSSPLLQAVTDVAVQPVTLSWNVLYGEYYIVSPQPGAIRGTSIVVNPTATTTYTLYATNPYGRSTATVTVAVP
jgi:hypothetical protein